jgi:dolichol-phosphate mannosyltransferase
MKKTIEIVSSALNEEAAIPELYERLNKVFLQEIKYNWKLTIFDNGSSDGTWSQIEELAKKYENVKGFRMSRTFSLDAAFTAGMNQGTGDAIVIMASDLQDPPEVIPSLLREWEKGIPHVMVKLKKRNEMSFLRRILTRVFYKISNWASDGMIPDNVSDFRLMDKCVYRSVNEINERNRFMRGLISWTGFPSTFVEIDRPARHSGKTKTKYFALIKFAIRGIFATSEKPINLISGIGFFFSFVAASLTIIFSALWLFSGVPFAGFGTIVGLLTLGFSINLGVLGVLAEYIGLIYTETKGRPHSIIWKETYSD